jgi:hypothetical protein
MQKKDCFAMLAMTSRRFSCHLLDNRLKKWILINLFFSFCLFVLNILRRNLILFDLLGYLALLQIF